MMWSRSWSRPWRGFWENRQVRRCTIIFPRNSHPIEPTSRIFSGWLETKPTPGKKKEAQGPRIFLKALVVVVVPLQPTSNHWFHDCHLIYHHGCVCSLVPSLIARCSKPNTHFSQTGTLRHSHSTQRSKSLQYIIHITSVILWGRTDISMNRSFLGPNKNSSPRILSRATWTLNVFGFHPCWERLPLSFED